MDEMIKNKFILIQSLSQYISDKSFKKSYFLTVEIILLLESIQNLLLIYHYSTNNYWINST